MLANLQSTRDEAEARAAHLSQHDRLDKQVGRTGRGSPFDQEIAARAAALVLHRDEEIDGPEWTQAHRLRQVDLQLLTDGIEKGNAAAPPASS